MMTLSRLAQDFPVAAFEETRWANWFDDLGELIPDVGGANEEMSGCSEQSAFESFERGETPEQYAAAFYAKVRS